MNAHRVRQKEIPGAGREDGGRESTQIAVDRRQIWMPEILPIGVEHRSLPEPTLPGHEHVVDELVAEVGVACLGEVRPGRAGRDGGRQR